MGKMYEYFFKIASRAKPFNLFWWDYFSGLR